MIAISRQQSVALKEILDANQDGLVSHEEFAQRWEGALEKVFSNQPQQAKLFISLRDFSYHQFQSLDDYFQQHQLDSVDGVQMAQDQAQHAAATGHLFDYTLALAYESQPETLKKYLAQISTLEEHWDDFYQKRFFSVTEQTRETAISVITNFCGLAWFERGYFTEESCRDFFRGLTDEELEDFLTMALMILFFKEGMKGFFSENPEKTGVDHFDSAGFADFFERGDVDCNLVLLPALHLLLRTIGGESLRILHPPEHSAISYETSRGGVVYFTNASKFYPPGNSFGTQGAHWPQNLEDENPREGLVFHEVWQLPAGLLGESQFHLDDLEEFFLYGRALSVDPEDPLIWHNLGLRHSYMGNVAQARTHLEMAHRLKPENNWKADWLLGEIALDYDADPFLALKHFRQAILFIQKYGWDQMTEEEIAEGSGNFPKEVVEQVLQLEQVVDLYGERFLTKRFEDPRQYFLFGNALYQAGFYAAALTYLEPAVEMFPDRKKYAQILQKCRLAYADETQSSCILWKRELGTGVLRKALLAEQIFGDSSQRQEWQEQYKVRLIALARDYKKYELVVGFEPQISCYERLCEVAPTKENLVALSQLYDKRDGQTFHSVRFARKN